jgi:carbon monoxide dehydrogenase subunit G
VELSHSFTVPASTQETWDAFCDIESVAGCFPGAAVTSVEGDEFNGTCKVKLGPISLTYAGKGQFVEKDDAAHRFVIEAKGRDKRGNGTAGATVTAALTDEGGTSTRVEVTTDLAITGKPAQFGRGVIQDVSDKLLQQFVTCLETKVGGGAGQEPPAGEKPSATPAAMASGGDEAGGQPVDGSAAAAAAAATPPRPQPQADFGPMGSLGESEDDALDLGATVVPILLRTYWKQLVGALLVLLVLRGLLRRRRRS